MAEKVSTAIAGTIVPAGFLAVCRRQVVDGRFACEASLTVATATGSVMTVAGIALMVAAVLAAIVRNRVLCPAVRVPASRRPEKTFPCGRAACAVSPKSSPHSPDGSKKLRHFLCVLSNLHYLCMSIIYNVYANQQPSIGYNTRSGQGIWQPAGAHLSSFR